MIGAVVSRGEGLEALHGIGGGREEWPRGVGALVHQRGAQGRAQAGAKQHLRDRLAVVGRPHVEDGGRAVRS